jgi:hypothetical protein
MQQRGRSVSSSRPQKRARAASASAEPGSRSLSRSRSDLSLSEKVHHCWQCSHSQDKAKAKRLSHIVQRPANRIGRAGSNPAVFLLIFQERLIATSMKRSQSICSLASARQARLIDDKGQQRWFLLLMYLRCTNSWIRWTFPVVDE